MQISEQLAGQTLTLTVAGRLDSSWADHLDQHITRAVHRGHHHLVLHLAALDFISSAGIRVLLKTQRELKSIDGTFAIIEPSKAVRDVLRMSRLDVLLLGTPISASTSAVLDPSARLVDLPTATLHVLALAPGMSLQARPVGQPRPLGDAGWATAALEPLACPADTLALGLGALGDATEGCRGRVGEFLAAGGAAAYLPGDDQPRADYLLAEGDFTPTAQLAYGVACGGSFSHQVRFESKPDQVLPLADLLGALLDQLGVAAAGFAIATEAACLVGASLQKSPCGSAGQDPLSLSAIRHWLSFTGEAAHRSSTALVVGVAARGAGPPALAPLLRPLGPGDLRAHVHAAVFSYHPIRKGRQDLAAIVRELFEQASLRDVLHLLADHREIVGAGDSHLNRGTCWAAPLSVAVSAEKGAA